MHTPTASPGPLRLFGRAFLLRCPRCGGPGVMLSWFALKERCPTCELVLDRGESGDYWLGAFTINFIVAEFSAVILTVILVLATLPDVPWDRVGFAAIGAAIALPIIFFPFSRTLWLALDLSVRPTLRGDRARPLPAAPGGPGGA